MLLLFPQCPGGKPRSKCHLWLYSDGGGERLLLFSGIGTRLPMYSLGNVTMQQAHVPPRQNPYMLSSLVEQRRHVHRVTQRTQERGRLWPRLPAVHTPSHFCLWEHDLWESSCLFLLCSQEHGCCFSLALLLLFLGQETACFQPACRAAGNLKYWLMAACGCRAWLNLPVYQHKACRRDSTKLGLGTDREWNRKGLLLRELASEGSWGSAAL